MSLTTISVYLPADIFADIAVIKVCSQNIDSVFFCVLSLLRKVTAFFARQELQSASSSAQTYSPNSITFYNPQGMWKAIFKPSRHVNTEVRKKIFKTFFNAFNSQNTVIVISIVTRVSSRAPFPRARPFSPTCISFAIPGDMSRKIFTVSWHVNPGVPKNISQSIFSRI